MKRWHGSCLGALLVLLIGGSALLFLVPFGGDQGRLVKPKEVQSL